MSDMAQIAGLNSRPVCARSLGNGVTFHYNPARLGGGAGAPSGSLWKKQISVSLGSTVRGAPLFVHGWLFRKGPHAGETHDMVYIGTTDNRVIAYAEDRLLTGDSTSIWMVSLGPPVTRSGSNFESDRLPPQIGITSSPVLDLVNSRLFVCSYQDAGGGNSLYRMVALDMDTGTVLRSEVLNDAGAAGRPTFDPNTHDQRGGLNLVDGHVYATFAAFLAYDKGVYHGWVVGCDADDLSIQGYFSTTRNVLAGGVWGPGGAASKDGILYIATGNGTNDASGADIPDSYWNSLPPGNHPGDIGDYFIAVVKLGVAWTGNVGRMTVLDWYQPTNAKLLNDNDKDLGGSSCLLLPDIGGTGLIVLSAKNDVYLLNRNNLGHWGGELWSRHVFGVDMQDESKCAPAYYLTPAGDHYVYFSGGGSPGLICYKVVVNGSTASLSEVWRAAGGRVSFQETCGSPTIGSVALPNPYALVWVVERPDPLGVGVLHAYDALRGSEVYNSNAVPFDSLGAVPHFAPVTSAGSSIYVGTSDGFALYRA
jgi:hypothetical protein